MKRIYCIVSMMLAFTMSACGDDITEIQRPEGWGVDVGDEENVYGDIVIKDVSEPMVHPGCLHSADDLKRVKEKVKANEAPWIDGWNLLMENDHFSQDASGNLPATTVSPNATKKIIRGGNTIWEAEPDNYNNASQQAHAAYYYALAWKVTDDVKYAQAAMNILNEWAKTCTSINGDSNMSLAAGLYGYQFANAGELLRDYEGWSEAAFKSYQQWMVDVFYKANHDFLIRHHNANPLNYWANWDLCNVASMLSIGILTDRRDIYNEAIEYLFEGDGNGNLSRTIVHVFDGENEGLAQIQESGRDQGHATLVIGLLGVVAQTVWNQGDDLFGWNDNVILKASEYIAKYNVAKLDVPFEPYSTTDNNGNPITLETVSSDSRGTDRDMWEVIYNHYAKIKNVEPKWSQYTWMGVEKMRPEHAASTGTTAGGLDLLGMGTLMYAR